MKKKNPIRKSVGYQLPWDKNETDTAEEITNVEPMQSITNKEGEEEETISVAHAEVRGRILLTELAITGKNFSKMDKEKKLELIKELEFLTSLDTELTNQ